MLIAWPGSNWMSESQWWKSPRQRVPSDPVARSRRAYRALTRLPAWWLYDEDYQVVASVRAHDKDEALAIFRSDWPKSARYIGKAPASLLEKDVPGLARSRERRKT